MDDDGWLTKAEVAELLAGRGPDVPVIPAGAVPDWLNNVFDEEKERMRESKTKKVAEEEAPPAKRRRTTRAVTQKHQATPKVCMSHRPLEHKSLPVKLSFCVRILYFYVAHLHTYKYQQKTNKTNTTTS